MLSLLGHISTIFSPRKALPDSGEIARLQLDAQQLARSIAEHDRNKQLDAPDGPIDQPAESAAIGENECFVGRGVITAMSAEHGIVNHALFFSPTEQIGPGVGDADQLRIGTIVQYLARRVSDDVPVHIVRITAVLDVDWEQPSEQRIERLVDELRDARPEVFQVHRRNMHGEVIGRHGQGRFVDVGLDNGTTHAVDLDRVRASFVPLVGDLVMLECRVQADMSFVDQCGELLEVLVVHPSRSKCERGVVTEVSGGRGVVDRKMVFDATALDAEYVSPQRGDRVCVEAIECAARAAGFSWRCLKVVREVGGQSSGDDVLARGNEEFRLKEDKGGLTISEDLRFPFNAIGQKARKTMYVRNMSADDVVMVGIDISSPDVRLVRPKMHVRFVVRPQQVVEYCFEACARLQGRSTVAVRFQLASDLCILRHIHVELGDNCEGNSHRHNSPRTHHESTNNQRMCSNRALALMNAKLDVIPGVKVQERTNFVAIKLGNWEPPAKLKEAVLVPGTRDQIEQRVDNLLPFLGDPLNFSTYERCMHNLLFLEEIQTFRAMRRYDRERAHFQRDREYLALRMPNVGETRPSLVVGDYVYAHTPWTQSDNEQAHRSTIVNRGDIHKVEGDRILLKFAESFHASYNGEDWKLTFQFSRTPMRKMHFAVQKSIERLGEDFLFPQKIELHGQVQLDVELHGDDDALVLKRNDELVPLRWFNEHLNAIQKLAVVRVLRGEARPMPYVLFGPPGTGKTSTLIETILQLFANVPHSRLLVAAPSNSAANLLAQRLIESEALQPGDFVRVAGYNAVVTGRIPDELLPFTALCSIASEGTAVEGVVRLDSGVAMTCNARSLGRHRITIGTCNTIGTMAQMQFARDHFTHALIDEAGQCLEAEALLPMTFLRREHGQIVLAGDPMQLGPVVMSRLAETRGLAQSMLVRMLDRFPYKADAERFESGYDDRLVTKLLYCYRSLPSIVSVFNRLYYRNELRPVVCAETSDESALLRNLDGILPGQGVRTPNNGVFFVGVRGENLQDAESPSWFNAAEAKSILQFVVKLYTSGVKSESIGIITPYTKQAKVLRNMLAEYELEVPKIGTVEEFQGQERMIIILSTVRSSVELLRSDKQFQLGFVSNQKRLNVALSRARALLVVYGNPHLLCRDASWRFLVRYCLKHHTYTGCDLPDIISQ